MIKIKDGNKILLIEAQLKNLFDDGEYFRDNEIFMFHTYCWCEKEDCAWCGGKFDSSVGAIINDICDTSAPNFWHRESGLRVWWYKHIGRSVEVLVEQEDYNINKIFLQCEERIKEN
jgi:hypothetical protein